MSWRFRKSFKVIPGVRINVSRRGISTTIGAAPFTVNLSSRGTRVTASVPGTGLSFSSHIPSSVRGRPVGEAPATTPHASVPQPAPAPSISPHEPLATEIKSASTEQVTSEGLQAFCEWLRTAHDECRAIRMELDQAAPQAKRLRARRTRWENGFVFRRVFPKRFVALGEQAQEAEARQAELEEQLRLSQLATEIDVPPQYAEAFRRLCDAFAALATSAAIWDMTASRAVDRVRERSAATTAISRERAKFVLGANDLLATEWRVPHLENRNGGDLYIYPGFILYHVSRQAFGAIDDREVTLRYAPIRFHETEPVPPDAQVVGTTWLKANKDGSRDRRFANNRAIPIACYGELTFRSPGGLHEEYLVSNAARAEEFARAWDAYVATRRSI